MSAPHCVGRVVFTVRNFQLVWWAPRPVRDNGWSTVVIGNMSARVLTVWRFGLEWWRTNA